MSWRTTVDPENVLLNVAVDGEPVPKGRPRMTRATVTEYGELRQGHAYTPTKTRQAEAEWAWIMRQARVLKEPVPYPVGALVLFRTRYSTGDGDNLWKLVADAMNNVIVQDDQQFVQVHIHVLRRCTQPGTELLVWMDPRGAGRGV